MKRGVHVAPDLIGESYKSGYTTESTREVRYNVDVSYITGEDLNKLFKGSFLARNSTTAEEKARQFVVRYLRPKVITAVAVELI